MIVAASTECFPNLTLREALERLVDLEYSAVEIQLREGEGQLAPARVMAEFEPSVTLCRNTHRLDVVAYTLEIPATGEAYFEQFAACCKLAKATKVVTLNIPSSELGTPFNEEVERLQRLVSIAAREGVRVGLRSQIGRLSQDPDTVMVLCNNVLGLGVALDPSHYIAGPAGGKRYEQLFKYTSHVILRDSTKTELQVRVGQGEIEYGRLVNSLAQLNYNRCLSVNILPLEGIDHASEMRKLRLLLESLL